MEQLNWLERDFTHPADPRLLPSPLERRLGRLEDSLPQRAQKCCG